MLNRITQLKDEFKSNMATSAYAVASARVFSLAAAAIQLPALTRHLAPDEYALIGSAIALGTYTSLATGDPYTLAFRRFPGSTDNPSAYQYATRRLLRTLTATGIAILLAGALFRELPLTLAIVGWAAGLASMRIVSMAWLMWDKPWRYALNLTASTGARTVTLVAMVIAGRDPLIALGVAGTASFLIAAALGPKAPRGSSPPKRPWPAYFGFSLTVASLGTTLATNFDRAVLPHLYDETASGQYAAMNQLANLSLGALLGIVQLAIFPTALKKWNAGHSAQAHYTVHITVHASAILTAVFLTTFAALGQSIFDNFLGPGYYTAAYVLPLLVAAGLYGLAQQMAWTHQFKLSSRRLRRAGYVAGGLSVTLVLALAPKFGPAGAAWACLVAFASYAVYIYAGTGLSNTVGLSVLTLVAVGAVLLIEAAQNSLLYTAIGLALILLSALAYYRRTNRLRRAG